jgi:hypothetical protein
MMVSADIVQKFTKPLHSFVLLLPCFSTGVAMLVRNPSISSGFFTLEELERQMGELIALRRAVCLLNASRDRPKGSRRRPHRASASSARGAVCYRTPERREFQLP